MPPASAPLTPDPFRAAAAVAEALGRLRGDLAHELAPPAVDAIIGVVARLAGTLAQINAARASAVATLAEFRAIFADYLASGAPGATEADLDELRADVRAGEAKLREIEAQRAAALRLARHHFVTFPVLRVRAACLVAVGAVERATAPAARRWRPSAPSNA